MACIFMSHVTLSFAHLSRNTCNSDLLGIRRNLTMYLDFARRTQRYDPHRHPRSREIPRFATRVYYFTLSGVSHCFPTFFYIHFHFLLSSSIVVSLHERSVFWCTSPVAWHCSLMCWSSCFVHMILRHLALRTQGFGIIYWIFRLCFPSFHSPFILGLRYVLSRKTTLRL